MIDKRPVLPYVTLQKNDASTYLFDPFTPTRNFQIEKLHFSTPRDLNGGTFSMTILGATSALSEIATIDSNIDEGNEVAFWLGKTDAGKAKIMLGVIEEIEIEEETANLAKINITGPDFGSDILDWRTIFGSRIQKKLPADQTKLDPTDDNVLASKLVRSILTSPEWYPDEAFPITVEDQGVIVDPANIQPNDVRISQLEANFENVSDKVAEINSITNSRAWIDANKKFMMRPKDFVTSSGLLFIDTLTDSIGIGWDQTKLGFIHPGAKHKRSVETHRGRIYGLGSNQNSIDQTSQTVSSLTSLSSSWVAQRFTPTFGDCYNIAVYLGGTPTVNTQLFLQEEKSTKPGGTTLRSLNIAKEVVQSGGGWVYFPIGEKLTVGANYWIVIANASGLNWYRNSADSGANTLATSSDGITWALTSSPNRFTMAFIHYVSAPLVVITPAGVTASAKHLHEEVIHRPDINELDKMNKYINGTFSILNKRKRILNLPVRSPDQIPQIGDSVRVRKQRASDPIDAFYTITGLEYTFQATEQEQTGTYTFNVEMARVDTYA